MKFKVDDIVKVIDNSFEKDARFMKSPCDCQIGDLMVCTKTWQEQQKWAKETNNRNIREAIKNNRHTGLVGVHSSGMSVFDHLLHKCGRIIHEDNLELVQRP